MMINKKYSFRPLMVSAFVTLAAFTLGSPAAHADKGKRQVANSVVGLSSSADSATTTLHIKGSAIPTFTVYKLENPSRVVVDLVGASLKTKKQGEADKTVWNVNTWAVGQVSAHNMSKARGSLVRVVVGLSRPSRYQVKAAGNDVLIEVTAKSKPTGISPSDLKRAQKESASARLAAEKELASAHAEAATIRQDATKREQEAKARIAQAEQLMAEAQKRSAAASVASRLASSEIEKAKARENSARAAEVSAESQKRDLQQAEANAIAAQLRADKANASESKSLNAKAARAARDADARRAQSEKAMRAAEARRKNAEKATQMAVHRQQSAADALLRADSQRKSAEQTRDRALLSGKNADQERRAAETAAKTAASRAQELKDLVKAEESRFEVARKLRRQEESAVAKASTAKAEAQRQSTVAIAAQKKLERDIVRLSKAKAQVQVHREEAAKALARADRAAADDKTSAAKRARLAEDAKRLSAARDLAAKKLINSELTLKEQRQQVTTIAGQRKTASRELAALEKQAARFKAKRSAEEKGLAILISKRSNMKLQLDEARKMRIDAQAELAQAKSARLAADRAHASAANDSREAERARTSAANDAREAERARTTAANDAREAERARTSAANDASEAEALLARTEQKESQVQRELELAKRARLSAESERRAIALKMKQAQAREAQATQQLKASQRASKSASKSASKAQGQKLAKAEAALEEAREERRLAEAARHSGEQALLLASEREKSASKKLALASKQGTSIKRIAAKTRLSEIDVVEKQDVTRVVIAMSSPASPRVLSNRGSEAVLEIPLAAIRNKQERTLDTSSLKGAVKSVSSYRDPKNPNNLKIVVDLSGPAKGVLKKVGNTFYWDFPKAAKATKVAARSKVASKGRTTSYRSQSVAGYGSASSPITQQTVAQISRRRTKTYRGQKIDLDYKMSDIHDLMRLLADVGGVNIIVPDDIRARVTIRLRRVPWDQALDVILASKGLGYKMEGPGLFRIATQKELDEEFEAKQARAKAKADSEPPTPEIFNLNYLKADAVQAQLESLLSRKGSLQVDSRTNAIIVNDVAANRRRVINMLTQLDTQTPQIQIEARIVEARSTFVRQFGIQWGGNMNASAAGGNATGLIFPSSIGLAGAADDGQTPSNGVGAAPTDFAVNLPAAIGTGSGGGIGLSLGSLGGNLGLNLRLSALEDEGSVRIISSPKITTSNNSPAQIKSGVSIPVSVVSANGVQTQFVPADLQLRVTPTVSLRDCAVSMEIDVKKNEADFVNTGARGDPTLLTKEAKTTILVQDGDTSVIGGIYTRNSGVSYSKVPFLGDLPVFGWLFKTTASNDERTEVLIFITPKITNRAFLPCAE